MQLSDHKLICYRSDQFKTTNEAASELFDLSAHKKWRIAVHSKFLQKFYLIDEKMDTTMTFVAPSEIERVFWLYQIRIHMKWSKATKVSTHSISIVDNVQIVCDSFDDEEDDGTLDGDGEDARMDDAKTDDETTDEEEETTDAEEIDGEKSDDDVTDDVTDEENDEKPDDATDDETDDETIHEYDEEDEMTDGFGEDEEKADEYDINEMLLITPPLNKRSTKRKFIEAEIIATEETYYTLLRKLLNQIIIPMFLKKYIHVQYYDQMVSTIPQILEFHQRFLEKLKKQNQDEEDFIESKSSLAVIFRECILTRKQIFTDIYVEYIKDYQTLCDEYLSLFEENKNANLFLKEQKLSTKMFLNFLILPIQRIPRYILLLSELKKTIKETSSEFDDMNDAVMMIKGITNDINERKRAIDIDIRIGNEWKEEIQNEDHCFVDEMSFITLFIIFILLFYVLFSYLFS